MAIHAVYLPSGSCTTHTASSWSRASSGSMVGSGRWVRSTRPRGRPPAHGPRRLRPRPRLGGWDSSIDLPRADLGDLDLGLPRLAEHGVDLPLGVLVGELGEARNGDDRRGHRRPPAVRAFSPRQDDGPPHPRVVRLEPRALPTAAKGSRDASAPPLDDADDLTLQAPLGSRHDAHGHLVAVDRAAQGFGGDVDVIGGARARHEAEAPGIDAEDSLVGLAAIVNLLPGKAKALSGEGDDGVVVG